MIISGMVKNSFVDYPGLIACVLFVPGCNYNCFYCHNRSLIDGSTNIISNIQTEAFLKKRVGKIDAVVISGGEPTLQQDLIPFIKYIKALGYKIKLDTNGSSPETIFDIIKKSLCDYIAVDYKAPALRYKEICGDNTDAQKVLKTINLLLENKINFEVRTTMIPQLKKEDLILMAHELPMVPRYVLNRYRIPEKYLPEDKDKIKEKPYTQADIEKLADEIKIFQPKVIT
ncbi:MAG: anaerobic ribonucleoside-triphosphate reductase activating protein [Clostridia bacterium]|nr:anaerobic ribonucleoside-triphosphate reductase activating protein [Clostridia bacterium]